MTLPPNSPLTSCGQVSFDIRIAADKPIVSEHARVQAELGAFVDATCAAIAAPSDDSKLSIVGQQTARRDLASAAAGRVREFFGPRVERLVNEAQNARRQSTAAGAAAAEKLGPIAVERASRLADAFINAELTDAQRSAFVQDVEDGVGEAILGALLLNHYQHGSLRRVAEARFAASIEAPGQRGDVERFEVCAAILRWHYESVVAGLEQVAETGGNPADAATGSVLLGLVNDAGRGDLHERGTRLGVIVPTSTSIGEASLVEQRRQRIAANALDASAAELLDVANAS